MNGYQEETSTEHHVPSQKATFSGLTALIGVLCLIIAVISVAVPHWGYYFYGRANEGFKAPSFYPGSLDNSGHFGPFQYCRYHAIYSICNQSTPFKATPWLLMAGVAALISIVLLLTFCLFSILHVAMQLQRRVIWVEYKKALFLKVVSSSLTVLTTILSVVGGALQFSIGGQSTGLNFSMGICFYLQICLIFVTILLLILSYLSNKKGGQYPIVPKKKTERQGPYESQLSDGLAVTVNSGHPYRQSPLPIGNGYTNNGFSSPTSVVIPPPTKYTGSQPIRNIAASDVPRFRGLPQNSSVSVSPSGPVSYQPTGRPSKPAHNVGSVESLDSTQSLNLSVLSFGSSNSTGNFGPLRPSLKKPKNKDKTSITSESSSKRVRLSLGAEQTSV